REKGEVTLGELVSFKWDKIYLIRSYDSLNSQQQAELFPQRDLLNSFSLEDNNFYWTIAYQRPGKPPFMIKVRVDKWHLRNRTNLWTTDPTAKLRRVPPDTLESTYCS